MGIYDEVIGGSGNGAPGTGAATAPGTEAATDPIDFDPYGTMPLISEADYARMFGTEPILSQPSAQPSNPRQADHVADVKGPAGKVVGLAQSFVGTPYVWGGTSPSGFDCSGFVQYVYRKIGVNLPRISAEQARSGTRIGTGQLQAGDLVAWDNSSRNNGADHIAIYIGGGRIAEAPRPGVPLRVRQLGSNEGAWGVRVL